MKFILGFIISFWFAFPFEIVDDPSLQHYLTVSLKDVNRIYCDGGRVGSVVYSKEKRIEVNVRGENVFVKILPLKKGKELIYEDVPRDLYVECGGEVYSLVLVPREVPARTIVLKGRIRKIREAVKFEQGEYLSVISELMRLAYRDLVPDGYEEKKVGKIYKEFMEADMYLLKIFEGAEFSVLVFEVRAKKDINLDPALFIPYIRNPLALSLVKEKLKAGEKTRLLVVVKRDV